MSQEAGDHAAPAGAAASKKRKVDELPSCPAKAVEAVALAVDSLLTRYANNHDGEALVETSGGDFQYSSGKVEWKCPAEGATFQVSGSTQRGVQHIKKHLLTNRHALCWEAALRSRRQAATPKLAAALARLQASSNLGESLMLSVERKEFVCTCGTKFEFTTDVKMQAALRNHYRARHDTSSGVGTNARRPPTAAPANIATLLVRQGATITVGPRRPFQAVFPGSIVCHGRQDAAFSVGGLAVGRGALLDAPTDVQEQGGWSAEPAYVPRDPAAHLNGFHSRSAPRVLHESHRTHGTVRPAHCSRTVPADPVHWPEPANPICFPCFNLHTQPGVLRRLKLHAAPGGLPPPSTKHQLCSQPELVRRLRAKESQRKSLTLSSVAATGTAKRAQAACKAS